MPNVDSSILAYPPRLAAARRARRVLPGLPMPLDAIARLAARLTGAPMAIVAVMDVVEEHFIGSHGLPAPLDTQEPVPVAYSLCKYIVSADHPVTVDDMSTDPDLRDHALAVEHGARAFAGVPLRDAADHTVGSLLVVDTVARTFTEADLSLLVEISALLAGLPGEGEPSSAAAVDGLDSASLLDGVNEAFIALDSAGVVIGWNPAAQTMLGWSAAEAQGRTVDELILPEIQRERLREALPRFVAASRKNNGWSGRTSVRHRDGRELPVHATVSSLRGRRGPLICAFLTDLTDQQDAERDASTQRGFLSALLDSLDTGVIAVDTEGVPIVFNRAMRNMCGIADDLSAPLPRDAFAESVYRIDGTPQPPEESSLHRALHGETVRDHEILIRVAGERTRSLSGNAQPIMTAEGQRLGAVVALHEITERRRVERFHDCQLAVVTALAHAGSVESAAAAITQAVATALGWPYIELRLLDEVTDTLRLVGHHSIVGSQLDAFAARPVVKGVGITGTVWATSVPLWVPDLAATSHPAAAAVSRIEMCIRAGLRTVLAVPVPDGDHARGVLTCFASAPEYDQTQITTLLGSITDQLGQFLARRRSQQLSLEVTRGRDDFLSLVGHEMRTPLTSISSYIDMLLDDAGPQATTEDTRELLEGIARNTGSLRGIVDDLLDLAALESGYLHITTRQVDLAEITRQSLDRAQPAAKANGIMLVAEVPDELITTGDPQRLRQVLDNLLSNAVKYSNDDGLVQLELHRDDLVTTITVADTGIGIPADERHQLFQRFYRASNARSLGIPGTGLGMSIVRAIVEAHHGTVTLNDSATVGTTITVRLPVDQPTTEPEDQASAAAGPAGYLPSAKATGASGASRS